MRVPKRLVAKVHISGEVSSTWSAVCVAGQAPWSLVRHLGAIGSTPRCQCGRVQRFSYLGNENGLWDRAET